MTVAFFSIVAIGGLIVWLLTPEAYIHHKDLGRNQYMTADEIISELKYPKFCAGWMKKVLDRMAAAGECNVRVSPGRVKRYANLPVRPDAL